MGVVSDQHSHSPFLMVAVGKGDLDVLPPAQGILISNTNCNLEVWSWKQSLSRTILHYSNANPRLTVKYLDDNIKTHVN